MLKRQVVLLAAGALLALAASRGVAQEGAAEAPAPHADVVSDAPAPVPPLTYNHYQPEADMGTIPARLYLAPRPVPPWVGRVYITYPPMAPHHWMHLHARRYVRTHPDGGMTTTTIYWDWRRHP